VAEVVFKFLPEPATRVAAIQTGEIDIAPRLTKDDAEQLAGNENLTIVQYPVDRVYYVAFNNITTGKGTPIEDVRVRQAIGHAIDVQAIIDSIFSGAAVRAEGFIAPGNLGYVQSEPVAYDVEKAKALLQEAGVAEGTEFNMACPDAGYPGINEVCQAIQSFLNDAGLRVNLDLMEANAYWDLEAKKELPPIFVDSWSVTINEAYGRLEGAVGKDETYANWADEKLHAMLDQILTTTDIDARAQLYGEMQTLMQQDPPFVYLYFPQAFEGVTKRVQNYQPRGAENYYLWDVAVSE
jgi:peptide/nickel transport system substrate-binding protein